MNIKMLCERGRQIWWEDRANLSQVIVRMGKVFWDICRFERNAKKDEIVHNEDELKKELWNVIFSGIKYCDDLGYDPEECIKKAIECQERFEK